MFLLRCVQIPQPHRPIATAACQRCTVKRECHCLDVVGMSREDAFFLSRFHVPQPHRIVATAACQRQAVGRKRNRIDSERMTCDQGNFRPGSGIVEPDAGAAPCGQTRAVRRPGHVEHVSFTQTHAGAFRQAPAMVVLRVGVLCEQGRRREKNEAQNR